MSLICGIDVGGKRARLCFLDPTDTTHPLMVRFEPSATQIKTTTHIDAARWAANSVPSVWSKFKPDVVWIEEARGHARSVFQLSVMSGALLAGLERTCPVDFVPAVECRKLVGLTGKPAKSDIVTWAQKETDADFAFDEHDADAYVVARAILAHGTSDEHKPKQKAA